MKSYFTRWDPDAPELDLPIDVIERDGDSERVIGRYVRDFGQEDGIFAPFRLRGKDLALYSPLYTATRIMELPSCKDIGGEEAKSEGFCPVEYFVPGEEAVGKFAGTIGFVWGCYWACPWEIHFLDLSHADQGILRRTTLGAGFIDKPTGPGHESPHLRDLLKFRISEDQLHLDLTCVLSTRVVAVNDAMKVKEYRNLEL